MIEKLSQHPLTTALVSCVVMALLGGALSGRGLETWYPSLEKPAFLIPLWGFYGVGVLYYLLFGTVIWRILVYVNSTSLKQRLLVLTVAIMVLNEAWNFVFFGMKNTLAGFVGLFPFFLALVVLAIEINRRDCLSGVLLFLYSGWVLYDIAWAYALWRLNS